MSKPNPELITKRSELSRTMSFTEMDTNLEQLKLVIDQSNDNLDIRLRQNLKRLAAEAGFNLVEGSFEEGAVISGWPDVVWSQTLGIYLQWHLDEAKTVAAGSTPSTSGGIGAGAWVNRAHDTLRSELIDNGSFDALHLIAESLPLGKGYIAATVTHEGDTAILDLTTAAAFRVTLNAHVTHITFTNASGTTGSMRYITLVLRQGTGVNLVEWPSNIRWSYNQQPVLAYEKDYEDIVTLVNFGTDEYWYGFLTGGGFHV